MNETLGADWFQRHRLKLRHLGVLLAVARTRHIGRAAQALHTSQPAVSKAIQEIERAAGVALFERGPEGTRPTPAGESMLRYAREVFGTLDRAAHDLQARAGQGSGTLTVGCNFSSAGSRVPRALALLKHQQPALRVRVQEGSLEMLLPELRARRLDVVVARWPRGRKTEDLEEQALYEEPMAVVCAPSHPLTRARPLRWQALGDYPWILPPEGSAVRADLEELFRVRRLAPRDSGIECASPFAISVLLAELQALAVCPRAIAVHLEADGLLTRLPLPLPKVFGPNSAMTLRGSDPTPAMQAFLEALKTATRHERAPH